MSVRKSITLTLPADEMLHLAALLEGVRVYTEAKSPRDSEDLQMSAIASAVWDKIRTALTDQLTQEEIDQLNAAYPATT